MSKHDPTVLPPGLPVPVDDGATKHLPGVRVPPIPLPTTDGADLLLGEAGSSTRASCMPTPGPVVQERHRS